MKIDFDPEEILRYSRQIVLPEIGLAGQAKIKNASVLIVGCGGLGSPIALYLSACGIGRIGIVDYDRVDLSNLQRQVIHSTNDVGRSKVVSAKEKMLAINPGIRVDAYDELFTSVNAEQIAAPYDIIVDGTDNLPTRYLLNDLCVLTKKPYVYGAVSRYFGQASVFDAQNGPCYRCLFPEPPPPEMTQPCSTAGVIGAIPGIIGLLQVNEVIKLITGLAPALVGQLLLFDAMDSSMVKIRIEKNPHCRVCGPEPEIRHLIDYEQFCRSHVRAADTEQEQRLTLTARELASARETQTGTRMIDLREPIEYQIMSIPGAENVPFHLISTEMRHWDKSEPVIFVCQFGFLSSIASKILMEAGFKEARSLQGGFQAWLCEQGKPVDHQPG